MRISTAANIYAPKDSDNKAWHHNMLGVQADAGGKTDSVAVKSEHHKKILNTSLFFVINYLMISDLELNLSKTITFERWR